MICECGGRMVVAEGITGYYPFVPHKCQVCGVVDCLEAKKGGGMKIVIEHHFDKREINGPFNLCASREDFTKLRDALNEWLDGDGTYGWLCITETDAAPALSTDSVEAILIYRQRHIANTKPSPWSNVL